MIRRVFFVLAWLAFVACSSSNESTPSAASDGGADDATGSNDAATLLHIRELNDGASSGSGQPIACGANSCAAPTGGMVPLSACCLPDNSCGASVDLGAVPGGAASGGGGGSGCLDTSAGTPDPSCPSQSVMGFSVAGCCSKAGVCGLDLSVAGLGCNSFPAGLGGFAPMDAGPPHPCGSGGKDAGVSAPDGAAPAADATADAVSE